MARGTLRRLRWRLGSFLRNRPMAFWHMGSERLVVAVLECTADEPLLHACACVAGQWQAPARAAFAPGIVEAAQAVSALAVDHAVALDESRCRLVAEPELGAQAPVPGDADSSAGAATQPCAPTLARHAGGHAEPVGLADVALTVPVTGMTGAQVVTTEAIVAEVVACFRQARLSLRAVDSATCAALNLAYYLDQRGDGAGVRRTAAIDPLAAVSVLPACEEEAIRLGRHLAVPVGLALGHFGLAADAQG